MQDTIETRPSAIYSRLIPAGKVQGTSVTNAAHENLGSIRDVVLDKYEGDVRYAVLEFGGFLGVGSKLFALPWEILKYDESVDSYVINVARDTLKAAPGFDSDDWPDMGSPAFDSDLRRYYGLSDLTTGFGAPPLL